MVRASDCGSECRGFESHLPPKISPYKLNTYEDFSFIDGNHSEAEKGLILYALLSGWGCLIAAQSENLGDCVKILIFAS